MLERQKRIPSKVSDFIVAFERRNRNKLWLNFNPYKVTKSYKTPNCFNIQTSCAVRNSRISSCSLRVVDASGLMAYNVRFSCVKDFPHPFPTFYELSTIISRQINALAGCRMNSNFFILHSVMPRSVFEFLVHSTASACVYLPLNHSRTSVSNSYIVRFGRHCLTWNIALSRLSSSLSAWSNLIPTEVFMLNPG